MSDEYRRVRIDKADKLRQEQGPQGNGVGLEILDTLELPDKKRGIQDGVFIEKGEDEGNHGNS